MNSISLDLESVLADIMTPFVSEYNERNNADLERGDWEDWYFNDVGFEYREFMEITGHNWKHNANEIPKTETNLGGKTQYIKERAEQLNVVTNRVGHDDVLRAWLNTHNVQYNRFFSVECDKADLGYDIYIDDKPELAHSIGPGQTLYLYDQPYNRDIETGMYRNVIRIESLADVQMQEKVVQ